MDGLAQRKSRKSEWTLFSRNQTFSFLSRPFPQDKDRMSKPITKSPVRTHRKKQFLLQPSEPDRKQKPELLIDYPKPRERKEGLVDH